MLQGPIRCTGRYFQSDPDESVDCICAIPPDPLVATPRSLGFFVTAILCPFLIFAERGCGGDDRGDWM
jgi:hypothetical protein